MKFEVRLVGVVNGKRETMREGQTRAVLCEPETFCILPQLGS